MCKIFYSLPIGLFIFSLLKTDPASASTPPTEADLTTTSDSDPPPTSDQIQRSKEIEITVPPPIKLKVDRNEAYFYRYRQALSFHGGLSGDVRQIQSLASTIGFQYRFEFPENGRSEIGADLLTSGTGLLHASRFYFFDDSRTRLFVKYGMEIRIVPSEELVTFLKLENWRTRFAAGLEWNAWQAFAIRLDLEVHLGVHEQKVSALTGLSYSF
jgi:hypothetical protein